MPYPNEHAQRINNPDKYIRLRRKNDEFGAGIDVIYGVLDGGKTEIQAIRFDKSKFSVAEAKKWLSEHDYKTSGFEPASQSAEFKELSGVVYGETVTFQEGRDAIIQGLGVALPGYQKRDGSPLSFDPELYEEALQSPDIPLVFAKNHLDNALWVSDREEALKKGNGRIVGEATNKRVVRTGKIRAQATLDYGNDAQVEDLYQAGHLGVSPVVEYFTDQSGEISRLKIHHLLLFPEDKYNQPGDKNTVVFKEEANMTEEIVQLLKEQIKEKDDKITEVSGSFAAFKDEFGKKESELTGQIASFKEENEKLFKENAELKKTIIDQDKASDFATFMAKLPDGMKHTEEQKKELQEKFFGCDKNGRDIMVGMASFMSGVRPEETRETGNNHFESFKDDDAEVAKIQAELRSKTGKV